MNNSLEQQFEQLTTDLDMKLNNNEWLFSNFRDDLVNSINESQAFNTITEAIDLILKQKESHLFYECLLLILALARKSNTTEVPEKLQKIFRTSKHKSFDLTNSQ